MPALRRSDWALGVFFVYVAVLSVWRSQGLSVPGLKKIKDSYKRPDPCKGNCGPATGPLEDATAR